MEKTRNIYGATRSLSKNPLGIFALFTMDLASKSARVLNRKFSVDSLILDRIQARVISTEHLPTQVDLKPLQKTNAPN